MAVPNTLSFGKMRVEIGDGATPEIFDAPCGFNSRSLTESKNLTEIDLPDCADEDAAAWVGRDVRSMTWSVGGEGVLASENIEVWNDFFRAASSTTVQIVEVFPAPVGTITKRGKAHLATFTQSATRGERVQFTVEMQGDGPLDIVTP